MLGRNRRERLRPVVFMLKLFGLLPATFGA
jgi:hypothetical protein